MAIPEITLTALRTAAQAASDKLGENISAVDVRIQLGITDAFFFASADNERQVKSISDEIQDVLRETYDLKPIRSEGVTEGRWILLDYGHFVVHLQTEEERILYALDRVWGDAPVIDLGLEEAVLPSASDQDSE